MILHWKLYVGLYDPNICLLARNGMKWQKWPSCTTMPAQLKAALNSEPHLETQITNTPQRTSVKGLIVSIRWYLGYLNG